MFWIDVLAKLFSATILNQNEPIEKQAWWGEMANCFLEQNRFVMKKREKTTPSLRLWVVQLLVFQNNNSSSTMPVAGDLGL